MVAMQMMYELAHTENIFRSLSGIELRPDVPRPTVASATNRAAERSQAAARDDALSCARRRKAEFQYFRLNGISAREWRSVISLTPEKYFPIFLTGLNFNRIGGDKCRFWKTFAVAQVDPQLEPS
jgi:hypothetical protein